MQYRQSSTFRHSILIQSVLLYIVNLAPNPSCFHWIETFIDSWRTIISSCHTVVLSVSQANHSVCVWSLQHYYLCSLAPENKTAMCRQMLLLGGNAAGNCKLKPLFVYHVENPRALKWKAKGMLPVIWKRNSNASVTETVFEEWFNIHFVPAVRQHCSWNNLLFKALLLLGNALGHRQSLQDFYPEIKVVFLPPKMTCKIQRMDLSFIAAFKRYYMWRVISQAIRATDKEGGRILKEFWKWYNIWNGMNTIGNLWAKIKECTTHGC